MDHCIESEIQDFKNTQFNMLFQERLRRSSQQFQYIKLSLVNVGLLSVVGAFSSSGDDIAQAIGLGSVSITVLALMAILSLISLVLFLLWIDEAIIIGGIDIFLKHSENRIFDDERSLSWFLFREDLNKSKAFKMNKYLFNIAIVLSFVSPPFLIFVFVLVQQIEAVPMWLPVAGISLIIVILIALMIVWRQFTKSLYD